MIELNLSYEESKKIVELGYDFGRKFGDVYKKRDCPYKYILVKYEKIKAQDCFYQIAEEYYDTHVERFTLEMQSIDYEESIFDDLKLHERFELGEIFNDQNSKGFVPIIPKAALEACLPTLIIDENDKRDYFLSYNGQKKPTYHYHKYSELFKTETATYLNYGSAFEAFLWCHEYFRKELKAKFDEVIT